MGSTLPEGEGMSLTCKEKGNTEQTECQASATSVRVLVTKKPKPNCLWISKEDSWLEHSEQREMNGRGVSQGRGADRTGP